MTPPRLDDPARLTALRATDLLGRDQGSAFERIARFACRLLGVPMAAVSLIDDRQQTVLALVGFPADTVPPLEISVEASLCARVILGGELVVDDLREHPTLRGVAGIAPASAVAYAGVPITTSDGLVPGVLCVLDPQPRTWSEPELATLRDLAASAAVEIELSAAKRTPWSVEAARDGALLERYRLLSRESRDIILFWRPGDGRIVEANEAAVAAYGYDRAELLALSMSALRASTPLPTLPDPLAPADESGMLSEAVHRRRDGTTFPVEANARGADLGGERLVLAIIRDVTERKVAERERAELLVRAELARAEATQANRLKDEFLSTLSHELRTPLNAILGWTRMLQSGQVPESRRAHALETIERNAHAQARLVDDILDVSRIVSGKLPLEIVALDPFALVRTAVDSLRLAAEARSVHLEASCSRNVGMVYADPARMQQVVWNLLSNGVRFTPRGGRVAVRLRRVDEQLEIEVTDTGQGIAPEFLPHVFERFRQEDAGNTRQHGGLGLGLAIVRHLVELHGGSVSVASDGPGRGATFVARFPLIAMEFERSPSSRDSIAPAVLSAAGVGAEHEPSLAGVHVLVVDDDDDARELLRALLQSCGAKVSTAATAAEASQIVRAALPDVMVADIGMPGEDGVALITRIRRWAPPEGGSIPAVALTAFARPEDRARALAAGFSVYLTKPVDLSLLIQTVARVLRRAPAT